MNLKTLTVDPVRVAWAVLLLLALDGLMPCSAPGGTRPSALPKLNVQETPISREVKARTSLAPVIKKIAPSVVNISSTTILRERRLNPFFSDPFLRRFFGEDALPQAQPRERRSQNLGSGVIVSADGYILTANHVIEGASEIKVALVEGDQELTAKVVGTDAPTDIAVLKVAAGKDLLAITIADSDTLEVGDQVLALGNPFGVGQTVTSGLVSALGRGGFGITGYEDFVQTDAAINPGNSGGPLVDAEGRLIGINTAIISASGGFNGVGFAVPINMARFVMERLIVDGQVRRGYLGISIQALTPDLAKEFRLPDESSGVLVGGFAEGSPARKAGVREGDFILEVNGKKLSSMRSLQILVAQIPPGSKVDLRILRGGTSGGKATEKSITVTLAELPQEEVFGGRRSERPTPEKETNRR